MSEIQKSTGMQSTASTKSGIDTRESPHNFAGRRTDGASSYTFPLKNLHDAKYALANAHFAPNPECIEQQVYGVFPELNPRRTKKDIAMAKKTKAQKKVKKVLSEYKEGELNIGKSKEKVKSRKQAVAIALSEAGLSKKKKTRKKAKKKK